ncbi:cilia- and flagella-associated protein 68-like [Halichondria panicea]|uniref:cilia- and flagella-associated protein 68-like n=1 Tax=Halichondria panicea TaxID=6063 RepID=UPI00312B82DB
MATKDPQDNLTFRGFLKASGQAQSWDDTDKKKASKFGWKTETAYSTDTLVGNWNEEWFDVSKLSQSTRPLSQYSYCFETTYKKTYDKSPPKVPEVLKYRQDKELGAFPAHQPVLDPPELKQHYNAFMTTSMEAYRPPNKQTDSESK